MVGQSRALRSGCRVVLLPSSRCGPSSSPRGDAKQESGESGGGCRDATAARVQTMTNALQVRPGAPDGGVGALSREIDVRVAVQWLTVS